jgi:hypothetical protein
MRTYEEFATDQLRGRIEKVAARLRDLAVEVDRESRTFDRVGQPGRPSYATVARNVQHAVLRGLANLSLDGLTDAAHDADQARTMASVRATVAEEIAAAIDGRIKTWEGMGEQAEAGNEHLRQAARIAREHGKES